MKSGLNNRRQQLIRESALFQLKLLADGVRDFLLVPVSLVATLVGLIRSSKDPEREFNSILELGRKSEQWINLFGTHDPLVEAGDAGSIDLMVTRAEEILGEQVKQGDVTENAGTALKNALDALHERARADRQARETGSNQ